MLQEVRFVLALCAAKSGKIMAFKFPVLKPKTIDCSGLPVHDFKCLTNKEIIGKGAYGAVFTYGAVCCLARTYWIGKRL